MYLGTPERRLKCKGRTNKQKHVALWKDPTMSGPVWVGLGMDWLQGLTFRQRWCAVELLQRRFQFIHLSLLNKGLKSGELLEDRGKFAPPGYTAQEILHHPSAEMTLFDRQRDWRRRDTVIVCIKCNSTAISAFTTAVYSFCCCTNLLVTYNLTCRAS